MSVKCKKSGLVIAWSRTMTILSPWRRGKADTVVDREVVLTKVKALSRSQRNLLNPTTISSSVTKPEVNPNQNQVPFTKPDPKTQAVDSGLWKRTEDSDDSGIDSPLSPLRSHNSPVHNILVHNSLVHSRGSSCDSGNSDQTEPLSRDTEDTECYQATNVSQVFPDEVVSAEKGTELTHGSENSQVSEKPEISDGMEEFMEECCRLQARSLSGLGYLDQVCRLVERVSRLQDLVLHLQRELRVERLNQRPDRELRTNRQDLGPEQSFDQYKLAFVMQHCTCGAVDRLLSPAQTLNHTRSLSRTHQDQYLSQDLRTIPECPPRLYSCSESAPCRRRRSRRSLTDGSSTWSGYLHRQLSERSSSSWSRVQDFLKTRTRSKSRLRPGFFKTSCPQLHRPEQSLDQGTTRSSMIILDQHADWSWLH